MACCAYRFNFDSPPPDAVVPIGVSAWNHRSMTPTEDDLASAGFADGERYHNARPRYAADAVDYLITGLGIDPHSHVLDLGAGTGLFTRELVGRAGRVSAVEPTAGMRDVLVSSLPDVQVLDGCDVDIPLDGASVDAVVVAQAFHWFDAPRSLREIHRVLVPDGALGLIWNERDESVDWVRELSVAMLWPERQPYEVGSDFTPVIEAGPFSAVQRRTFRHWQTVDHDGLISRVLTTSYIAVMEPAEQQALITDVRSVIDQLPETIDLPYVTDVYRATSVGA